MAVAYNYMYKNDTQSILFTVTHLPMQYLRSQNRDIYKKKKTY